MRSTLAVASLFAALALTPGCNVYFGDDDDDCQWGGEAPPDYGAPEAPTGLRNPYTGQCEYYGGGGGGCTDPCGPCDDTPAEGDADRAPLPSWGTCDGMCTGLDEMSCLATTGCRGGYIETCGAADAPCDLATQRYFYECWSVDQSGPVQGSCENLDAWSCSAHDDCVAVHVNTCSTPAAGAKAEPLVVPCLGEFVSCQPEVATVEPGCYDDSACAAEETCNAAEVCLPPPGCGSMGESDGIACPAVCYGWCVPQIDPITCEQLPTEDECVARDDCTPLYEGVNCTCDAPDSCTCEDWLFEGCSSMGG